MDTNDANLIFGSANIEKVIKFRMLGKGVLFADNILIMGSPASNAIIVWSIDGRVAVKGVLYSVTGLNEAQTAIIEIRFRHSNGQFTTITKRRIISQGLLHSRLVEKVSPAGHFDQVEIQLKHFFTTDLGSVTTVLLKKTFRR